ncbi:MAG: hypothetical protein IJU51_00135 [Clostridia bacterium]|nr:hypothetical protein [Clostridia bacterium]
MTLTDACELQELLKTCTDASRVSVILDEYGEDSDEETSEMIFGALSGNTFTIDKGAPKISGVCIVCPKCGNSSPDKLLSSISELLSGAEVHLGCCECGEQFSIKP